MEFPDIHDPESEEIRPDDVFEPYSKLIPILIKGKQYMVPENNTLLRALQYLNSEVAYGNFCWNGDCRNCQIVIRRDTDGPEVTALGCLTKVVAGLQVLKLPLGISVDPQD